jgi:hypothetical protein
VALRATISPIVKLERTTREAVSVLQAMTDLTRIIEEKFTLLILLKNASSSDITYLVGVPKILHMVAVLLKLRLRSLFTNPK